MKVSGSIPHRLNLGISSDLVVLVFDYKDVHYFTTTYNFVLTMIVGVCLTCFYWPLIYINTISMSNC